MFRRAFIAIGISLLCITALGRDRAAAVGNAVFAVNAPAAAYTSTPFTATIDLTAIPAGSAWSTYVNQLRYNTSVLKVNSVTPGGIGTCTTANGNWGVESTVPVVDWCAFENNLTTTGPATVIQFQCLRYGTSPLHLVTLAEDSNWGTALFDTSAVNFPTLTSDATVTCFDVTGEIDDAGGQDITGGRVDPGTVIHDTSVVSPGTPAATGTVDFHRYATIDCSGFSTDELGVTLVNGRAPSSTYVAPLGFLSYRVHYNGDVNYPAQDGQCLGLTVKYLPTVSGAVHNASHTNITSGTVPEGTTAHTSTTITGSAGPTPSGTVTFHRYAGTTCAGSPSDESGVVLQAGTAESTPFVTAGSLSYRVHYDGDATYAPTDGTCFSLTVGVVTIAPQFHNSSHQIITSFAFGMSVHLRVTIGVDQPSLPVPTGTVDFSRYTDANCPGSTITESGVPLVSGVAESSSFVTGTSPISYRVHYNGDGTYPAKDGACVSILPNSALFAVNAPAAAYTSTPFTATIDLTAIPAGSAWSTYVNQLRYNTSVLKVNSVTPGGIGTCTTANGNWGVESTVPVVDWCAFENNLTTTGPATVIQFQCLRYGTSPLHLVTLAEDSNWGTALFDTSAVNFPTLTSDATVTCFDVTGEIDDAGGQDITGGRVDPGTVIHDTSVVSPGTPAATGTVDFHRYATIDCSGFSTDELGVTLVNGRAPSSTYVAPLGFLSYRVHYNGDVNYPAQDGQCLGLTVKYLPTVSGAVHNASHTNITSGTVPEGTTAHTSTTITGSAGPTPSGTVTFHRYAGTTCAGSPSDESGVVLQAGTAESTPFVTAGSLSYRVHYDGDATYAPTDGTCFSLTVGVVTIAPQFHNSSHQIITSFTSGAAVHLRVAIGVDQPSLPVPTGIVTFSRYIGASCPGSAVTESVALVSGIAESSSFVTGTTSVSYRLHYNGDAAYPAKDGTCVSISPNNAVFAINAPTTARTDTPFTATIDLTSIPPGATWGGWVNQLAYDTTILRVNSVTSGGVATCTVAAANWDSWSTAPVKAGCAFQSARVTGTATVVQFQCLRYGAAPLHLVTLAEDPAEGTALFDENAVNFPTITSDATVTCDDGDGIDPQVDPAPNDYTNDFSDVGIGGTTFGTITARNGLTVSVTDAPNPAGVLVSASGTGGAALIDGCTSPPLHLELFSGAAADFTCGSAIVNVVSGQVRARFGTLLASLAAGAHVTAEQSSPGIVSVSNDPASPVTVVVGGVSIAPGATASDLADGDGDGLVNTVETNTGVFMSLSDTGTNPSVADTDGDLLSDGAEVLFYDTDPFIQDTDGDGCGDGHEVTFPALSPTNSWDFFSVPVPALMFAPSPSTTLRDGAVGAADAQAVFSYFKAGAKTGKAIYEQDLNNNGVKDGIEYDRTVIGPGMSGPPDGVVSPTDAQLAFAQFKMGYHC